MKKPLSNKITPEEYAAAYKFRTALEEILNEKVEERVRAARKNDYAKTAWAMHQADCIGMQRAYADILDIIEDSKNG